MSSVSRRHFIQVNLLKNGTSAIVEDARLPNKYRMLISTVDVIFADVAQPDQARIVIHNAQYFLKDGGHVVISIKASCVDSTIAPSAVFTQEVQTLRAGKLKPIAQITLEPYERDHAMVTGKHGVLSGMRMIINPVRSSIPSPPVGLSWGFCCKNAAVYTKCCLSPSLRNLFWHLSQNTPRVYSANSVLRTKGTSTTVQATPAPPIPSTP